MSSVLPEPKVLKTTSVGVPPFTDCCSLNTIRGRFTFEPSVKAETLSTTYVICFAPAGTWPAAPRKAALVLLFPEMHGFVGVQVQGDVAVQATPALPLVAVPVVFGTNFAVASPMQ